MKISVTQVIRDHLITLRDVRSLKQSKFDLMLFYGLPTLIATLPYLTGFCVSRDFYNVSITLFGIFVALLLNIQVAVFGIFQRRWDTPSDTLLAELQTDKLNDRDSLLKEVNANISYLVLASCLALFIFLTLYAVNVKGPLASGISIVIYAHFLLTLLMVIKRSHALFQQEYKDV